MGPKLKIVRSAVAGTYETFVYLMLYLVMTGAILVFLALTLENVIPNGQGPVIALFVFSAIPPLPILYFRWKTLKWRHDNPDAYKAEKAMQEAALATAQSAPPGKIKTGVIGVSNGIGVLLKVALYIAAGCLALYTVYLVMISIPVSVAIIIGAIIIGFCILVAK